MKLKEIKPFVKHEVIATAIIYDGTKEKTRGVLTIHNNLIYITIPPIEHIFIASYEYRPEQIIDIKLIK
jgi:hypothetical protein